MKKPLRPVIYMCQLSKINVIIMYIKCEKYFSFQFLPLKVQYQKHKNQGCAEDSDLMLLQQPQCAAY